MAESEGTEKDISSGDRVEPGVTTRTEGGFLVVQLANEYAAAEVLPELGGKIWNLWDRLRGTQWLWHNGAAAWKRLSLGEGYDDHWAGGWEELFPNDAPGAFEGRELPDHGEWWSQPWEWETVEKGAGEVSVRLRRTGTVVRTECEKWVILDRRAPGVTIRYRITSRENRPFHFLFKQHLAVAAGPAHRLELPGGRATPVDPGFGTLLGEGGPCGWPVARGRNGNPVDLSMLLAPESAHREFVYVSGLPEGWCGVRHEPSGARLRLHFPLAVFPYTWLFLTYGGWRGLYTAVLEPCTNMPKDLETAVRDGHCASLQPNQSLECEVRAVLS